MRNHRWIWIVGVAAPFILLAQSAPKDVAGLSVTPAEVTFRSADEGIHVLVTGTTAEGEKIDLSASAQFTPADPIVKVGDDGLLHPVRQGDTKVTVTAGGRQAQLMAHVGDLSKPQQISFIRDVAPVLNKVGCTAGTCHGSAKGKNGFKLSLRGYDSDFDYQALINDIGGRRFNRAIPEDSLVLLKPTAEVPHEGRHDSRRADKRHPHVPGDIVGRERQHRDQGLALA